MTNSSKSPVIGQNLEGNIFDFQVSGPSAFINENCRNSRTSYGIDMKLELVTKLDKKRRQRSKKIDCDIIFANCAFIIIFLNYGQFGAIRQPESGRMVYKT